MTHRRVPIALATLAGALLTVTATAPGQLPAPAADGPSADAPSAEEPSAEEPSPIAPPATSDEADAPAEPSVPSRPARLLVTTTGSSRLLPRFASTVRADLSLVEDVSLVRTQPDATLSVTVELSSGVRSLHARLLVADEVRWEASTELGPVDARPGATDERVRRAAHIASDAILGALTDRPGSFDSTLVYARRGARRRKDVWRADADGQSAQRVSSGRVSAMLPTLAHGDVWYSVVDPRGLFVTRAGVGEAPVLESEGLTMGVQPCGERIVFSSTRDGDTEIYSATPEGLDIRRLTYHPGIDVSPTCNAAGDVAFVSNRSGSPQIHLLAPDDLHPRRIEQPDGENQTPNFCADPERSLLAFTRVVRGMQVWTVDGDGDARRVSPAGRRFKDPAFSPDCRLLAYVAPDGIWISSLDGRRRRRVVSGATETVRWAARVP